MHMHRCLVSIAGLYRNWKGSLVRDYLRKGKSPCDDKSAHENHIGAKGKCLISFVHLPRIIKLPIMYVFTFYSLSDHLRSCRLRISNR
jgi:hypothetical protein